MARKYQIISHQVFSGFYNCYETMLEWQARVLKSFPRTVTKPPVAGALWSRRQIWQRARGVSGAGAAPNLCLHSFNNREGSAATMVLMEDTWPCATSNLMLGWPVQTQPWTLETPSNHPAAQQQLPETRHHRAERLLGGEDIFQVTICSCGHSLNKSTDIVLPAGDSTPAESFILLPAWEKCLLSI